MKGIAGGAALAWWMSVAALGFEEPPALLEQFLKRMEGELSRQPDYACTQDVERFARTLAEQPWRRQDSLSFVVALSRGKEYYSLPGEQRFRDRPLAEIAGHGTISTGQFALLASHVFVSRAAAISYRGESERRGRRAHEYEFDVPANKSAYRLRVGTEEAVVGFQGSFHVDAETLDLLELEVRAYDIPENLGLAQADTQLRFSRVQVGETLALLPTAATFLVAATSGMENLNRARLSTCRRFSAESGVYFPSEQEEPAAKAPVAASRTPPETLRLPPGSLLELALESNLDPAALKPGDGVKARLARPVTSGDTTLLPQGALFHG